MAEFGIGKLIGVVLFFFFSVIGLISSILEPLNDPTVQFYTENVLLKYKAQIALFVVYALAILAGAMKQWVKRELLYIQLQKEKEQLRSDKLDNDLKEFELHKKKNPTSNDTKSDSDEKKSINMRD